MVMMRSIGISEIKEEKKRCFAGRLLKFGSRAVELDL